MTPEQRADRMLGFLDALRTPGCVVLIHQRAEGDYLDFVMGGAPGRREKLVAKLAGGALGVGCAVWRDSERAVGVPFTDDVAGREYAKSVLEYFVSRMALLGVRR